MMKVFICLGSFYNIFKSYDKDSITSDLIISINQYSLTMLSKNYNRESKS